MNLKQHAKVFFQLFFILFFCTPIVQAQKTVDQIFTKSTTHSISLNQQDLSTKSTTFTQILDLGEYGTYQLSLEQTNLFSDGYLERRANKKNDGIKLPLTFRGTIQGQSNTLVSLTTSEGFLSGFIDTGEEVIFFEPYKNFDANAGEDEVIIYHESDVIDQGHSCAANHTNEQATHIASQGNQLKSGMAGCYEVEMVLVADHDMYLKYGENTLPHISSVLNNVEANYDNEFNDPITFIVVDNYIATDASLDIWTNTTNASTLLDEFAASDISDVPYDLASLWVTRDIVGTTASTVGLARTNGTCNFRYNLIEDSDASSASLSVILAHEIGHNFGATHDAEGSSTIMAPSVSNTNNTWSTQSEEEINAFYPTATCLCAAGYEEMDLAIASCSNSSVSGDVITISSLSIKNIGPLTSGAAKVGWYISSDNTITTDDYLLVFVDILALDSGITRSYSEFTRSLSNISLPDGNYYLGVIIDYENTLVEFSKENNICVSPSANITIGTPPPPEPDLIISTKSVNLNTVACGENITASARVRNEGDATAASSTLGYYLSTDTTWDPNDTQLNTDGVGGLAAAITSFEESATLVIPAGTNAGTYYILFRADANGTVAESNEDNNVDFEQITVTCGGPDLTISSTFVTSIVECGGSIIAYAKVSNEGDATAGASTLHYYLSTDNTLDNNDTQLDTDAVVGLAAGVISGWESTPVAIPAGQEPGTYYILFRADANDTVAESNEDNNVDFAQITVTCAAPEPDLVVLSKTVSSATVACGDMVTASAVVKNVGTAEAGSASYFRYYLSTNTTWEGSDTFLGQDVVGNLAANATGTETESLTIPANTAAGTYYVLFITDSSNLISESDESNNVASQPITVTCGVPDLVVLSKTVSSSTVACGDMVTASAVVKNVGTAAAGSASYFRYYLSTNTTWEGSDTFLGQDVVGNLAANATGTETESLTIPANTAAGTYYVLFITDSSNLISESDESNNVASQQITVTCGAPDLVVLSKTISSATVACGDMVTASAVVKNVGTAAAGSASYFRYYLSTNTTWEGSDTFLGQDVVSNLAANATGSETAPLTIPANTAAGTYYVLFITDSSNLISESDESNNVASQPIIVTCGAPGGVDCSMSVNSFPYTEGFENGFGMWTQETDDDINWLRDSNGTPSSYTGPASADEGSFYMFTEASGNPNKEAVLTSPCFDVSDLDNPILDVSYHMYGAAMGTFTIEGTLDGTTWLTLFTVTGQQNTSNGDAWNVATISLSPFIGRIVQLRFRGMTGGNATSDIAFDNINISDGGANKEFAETGIVDVRNYPNPFSTQTTIEFNLPKDIPVTLFVSDMAGKQIVVILDNEQQYAGKNQVTFDGSNYPSGIYYYTIQAGEYVATQKMVLTK